MDIIGSSFINVADRTCLELGLIGSLATGLASFALFAALDPAFIFSSIQDL